MLIKKKRSQTSFEYFLLLGVLTVIIVVAANKARFNESMKAKLMEFRDSMATKVAGS